MLFFCRERPACFSLHILFVFEPTVGTKVHFLLPLALTACGNSEVKPYLTGWQDGGQAYK